MTEGWENMFGGDLVFSKPLTEEWESPSHEPTQIWRIVPATAYPKLAAKYPLSGYALQVGGPEIDPARGLAIHFAGPSPDAAAYVFIGWTTPGSPNDQYALNLGKSAVFNFRALPVAPDAAVEMIFDGFPILIPGKRDSQRFGVRWNGLSLGESKVNSDQPIRVMIPAAVWNSRADVWLRLEFPDAISPLEAGTGADTRQFAFGGKSFTFHTLPAPATPAR